MMIIYLTLIFLSLYLFLGLLSSRLMKLIHFPNVTGYLITGIVFGPYVLGTIVDLITKKIDALGLHYLFGSPLSNANGLILNNISFISAIALAFIAFTIGQSFDKKAIKGAGKRIIITAITESLGGSLFVFIGLLIAHFFFKEAFPWPIILTLSAIASATAPAATVLVIKQYKAHGKVVDTLLPVVALDDITALILFAIFFSIAKALSSGNLDIYSLLIIPLLDIVVSLIFGLILGLLLLLFNKFFHSRNNRLISIIGALLIIAGVAQLHLFNINSNLYDFQISPLLSAMIVGAIYCNYVKDVDLILERVDNFTPPLFMLFFIISGAQLDISIYYKDTKLLMMFLPLAVIYFLMRIFGKYSGAYLGSNSEKNVDPMIKKYLGLMLLPQAGVAIGLATTSGAQLIGTFAYGYTYGDIVVCTILSTTIIYNIVGAYITKWALFKSGQIDSEYLLSQKNTRNH